jgi:hypothetical protein
MIDSEELSAKNIVPSTLAFQVLCHVLQSKLFKGLCDFSEGPALNGGAREEGWCVDGNRLIEGDGFFVDVSLKQGEKAASAFFVLDEDHDYSMAVTNDLHLFLKKIGAKIGDRAIARNIKFTQYGEGAAFSIRASDTKNLSLVLYAFAQCVSCKDGQLTFNNQKLGSASF